MKLNTFYFNKIRFISAKYEVIQSILNKKGGYLVAPAASALVEIDNNKTYLNSLIKSRVSILDSGFFCILVRIFYKKKIKKFSGYKFLKNLLDDKKIKNKKILLIDPSKIDSRKNYELLKQKKFSNIYSYIAPFYKKNTNDPRLIKIIEQKKPRYIIINIGGLKQEPLANYITKKISFKLNIYCTGAAIAFLTKRQAPINDMIDKFYLGWATRLIYNPRIVFIKFLKSFTLLKFFINQ